jgi:S-formylglutathione hydrolase FrmB
VRPAGAPRTNAPMLVFLHGRTDDLDGPGSALSQAIPSAVRGFEVDPARITSGGISMGGFGALQLGGRQRFCAVGGHSPALWLSGGETPPGAFDDGEDFDRSTPLVHTPVAGDIWLDVGSEDPFRAATEELGRRLGERVRVWRGGHDGDYWDAHMGAYLRFYARALERCRPALDE